MTPEDSAAGSIKPTGRSRHTRRIMWALLVALAFLPIIVWSLWYAIVFKQNYVRSPMGQIFIIWDDAFFDLARAPVIRYLARPRAYYHAFDIQEVVDLEPDYLAWHYADPKKPNIRVTLNLEEPICNGKSSVQQAETLIDSSGHFRFFFSACKRPDVAYTLTFHFPDAVVTLRRNESSKKPLHLDRGYDLLTSRKVFSIEK